MVKFSVVFLTFFDFQLFFFYKNSTCLLKKISVNTGSEKSKKLKIAVILLSSPFESPGVSPVNGLICIHPNLSDEHTDIYGLPRTGIIVCIIQALPLQSDIPASHPSLL